ncbi:MAG: pantothenate kinase [Flavobacteriaceae bacterium]|nr:pantothenate kinase [Flavobacteriaceae bacterium]|tara:strand:- start:26482 stop:27210 length:729 start_codon:yes stop_codon:yes gene_type:complete
MNLAIDVGNTRTKLAVFEENNSLEVVIVEKVRILNSVKALCEKYPLQHAVLSSVAVVDEKILDELNEMLPVFSVNHYVKLPFENAYKSPNTLGVDRIALVAAASKRFPSQNTLIIDAGTCITFDFLSAENKYLGGAISPGLQMRYNALNHYTANLPKLQAEDLEDFVGTDTQDSIHSGVINGVLNEIKGVMQQYEDRYGHLTVVLTGGDSNFLSKQLKSTIFANQNFLLFGLNEILILNRNL